MTTLTVKVEQRHIDAGYRCSSRRCPIALALVEALSPHYPFQPDIDVGGFGFCVLNADGVTGRTVFLPYQAANFIEYLDSGYPVEPFTFQITLP